jgi:hypothetical protein
LRGGGVQRSEGIRPALAGEALIQREVEQDTVKLKGKFRGVTLESGCFDLVTDDGLIKGSVADDLTEEDLERIHKLTNHDCVAELQKTTVRKIGGPETTDYVLLDARSSKEH